MELETDVRVHLRGSIANFAVRLIIGIPAGLRFALPGLIGAVLSSIPVHAVCVTLQKAFVPTVIAPGASTDLRFTLVNTAGAMARNDIGITDTLPSGLRVAPAPVVGGTCANAAAATFASGGGSTISIFNLQVPAGDASCTVTVRVTNAPGYYNADCAQQPADFTNSASNVSVTNATNGVSPSCLIVDRIFAGGFE